MSRLHRTTLLSLCALALLLRVLGRLDSGLWYDELWTLVDFGRLPLTTLVSTFGSDNNHPLYSLLAWLSLHAFGESAWALRLPALLFGVASVGMLYAYALRVSTPRVALLASLLLSTSYHHVWFSQNARGYTLLLFFTLASTYVFEKLLDGRGEPRPCGAAVIAYAIVTALGTYAHLSGVFVAAAHLLVWAHVVAYRGERDRRPAAARLLPLWGLLAAGLVSLALHALLLPDMLAFFTRPGGGHGKATSQWSSPLWTLAEVARSLGYGLLPGLFVLGSALLVLGFGFYAVGKRSVPRALSFLLPGLLGAAVMFALGRNLWPRFFFFQAGFILLVVVEGLHALAAISGRLLRSERLERVAFTAALAVLGLGWLAILPRAYLLPKQDFEGALRVVQAERRPGEAVLTTGLTVLPYARYYLTDFVPVETLPELDARLARSGALVLTTLPTFTQSRQPGLAQALRTRGRELARRRGSVGDGDVVVLRLPPTTTGAPE